MKTLRRRKANKTGSLQSSPTPGSKRSFKTIMRETTEEMPLRQQTFSLFIHSKPIWLISDVASKTLLRPNAILCGAILSFLVTIGVYLLSKNYGYNLSGFESIAAFLVGWSSGTVFDCVSILLRKDR